MSIGYLVQIIYQWQNKHVGHQKIVIGTWGGWKVNLGRQANYSEVSDFVYFSLKDQ